MSGNVPATGGAVRITRDDDRARRVCSLALDFMNAASPLSSSEIARTHYPGLSPDSFRRAFSRDRQTLASCGLATVERRVPGEESLWEADSARSFARGAEISPTDGAALELACRPLVDDPAFPLADELRLALAKVSRAFSETLSSARSRTRGSSRALDALRSCLAERTAACVTYVNARGETSERVLAPFGFFALRGALYLVADRLDDDGAPTGDPRTYRVDRVVSVDPLEDAFFSVPEGFSATDTYKYTVDRAHQMVFGVNRTAVNWEEVATHLSGVDPRAIMHVWLRSTSVNSIVQKGYRVIVSRRWYLDDLDNTWDVFYSNDIASGVAEQNRGKILGGEACMWAETVDTSDWFNTVWPRAAGVSEQLWTPEDKLDVDAALNRIIWFRCLLNRRGIEAAPVLNLKGRAAPLGQGGCYWQCSVC